MNPPQVTMPAETHSKPQGIQSFRQRGGWLLLARLAWVILSLITVGIFITAVWGIHTVWSEPQLCDKPFIESRANCLANEQALNQLGLSFDFYAVFFPIELTIEVVPWILVGVLIFSRKSREMFGLLFSLMLVVSGTLILDRGIRNQILFYYPESSVFMNIMDFLGSSLLIVWYLFPDGRFAVRWTRWLAIGWIGIEFLNTIFNGKSPLDPYTWPEPFPTGIILVFVASLAYSIVFRYRHISNSVQRQQIKWGVASGSVFVLIYIAQYLILPFVRPGLSVTLYNLTYFPLRFLSGMLVAVSIGFAIFRYRLWDIDIIINRTLVYGGLTFIVIGIYVLIVGALGTAMRGSGNLLISILATGLIAVLVQPLRDRLQRGVNRLIYGERDDPVTMLSRLGQRLETTIAPNAVLPVLTETVAQTLKLPYAAITWGENHNGEVAAAYGQSAGELARLPLSYHGETIGHLVVAPRAPGEEFSPADHHLLENIAHQAGMAVHAVSLTVDLQRSRQRLVTTREEERRRLRRDLHDGLGPNLASQGLKLAAVKQLLEKDPTSAAPLLDQVMAQNQSTVEEVRRLVYGLRPPALDELGLVAAIRDHVAGMDHNASLQIEIAEPPEGLPSLTAATEVAAYRIVLEALTNVIRHAHAQRCVIRFSLDQNSSRHTLQIEIKDDGIGLPRRHRAGVGTRSMRERAEEVGGTWVIESVAGGGTRVCVRMPLIVV